MGDVIGEELIVGEDFVIGGEEEGGGNPSAVKVPQQSFDLPLIYQFTSLMDPSRLIAELPINNTTFSLVLNGSGPWAGTLNVEDSEVRKTNWREATAVNRSALWIAVEKPYLSGRELIYGGRTTGRDYIESSGIAQLSGGDFYGYLAARFPNPRPPGSPQPPEEAIGYTEYKDPEGHEWAQPTTVEEKEYGGVAAATAAYWLLHQALEEVAQSIPITIVAASEPTPQQFWITFSAPRTQNQTLATMLSQLHQLGYQVGIDVIQQVEYVAGVPTVSIGIFYPRRGGESGLVIANRLDLEYQEDGTQQSNGVVDMVGGTGEEAEERRWAPAFVEEYPLLSQVVSHASVSPTTQSAKVLAAYEEGDLAVYSYPLTTPVVTLPMFGRPSILDLAEVGENVKLRIDKTAGEVPETNPRFPNGLDFTFRTVRIDATVPDQGLSTMKVTLNVPPSSTPIVPPE